jgi:hypothetical protein
MDRRGGVLGKTCEALPKIVVNYICLGLKLVLHCFLLELQREIEKASAVALLSFCFL